MSAAKQSKEAKKKSMQASETAAGNASPESYLKVAIDPTQGTKERNSALVRLTGSLCDGDERMPAILKMIGDTNEPLQLRMTALQIVQTASFSSARFSSWRPKYLTALRRASQDPDLELRQRILGILSREQDGQTVRKLLEGLKNPEKALLPAEKALQLLSYDAHAETYSVAKEIVKNPPNDAAKSEALRLLAADAGSVGLFEKLLRQKNESPEVRQISVAALQSLAPKKLQSYARKIVLDDAENDEVRAMSLTALAHFGASMAKDSDVQEQAIKLGRGKSKVLKASARQFLQKHRS